MTDVLDELGYFMYLQTQDYRDIRPVMPVRKRWLAIKPFLFTHAIIIGEMGDMSGYSDRWCYHTYDLAKAALDGWDGVGEPQGWHRHPLTDRRQAVDGFDQFGHRTA